jgi:hypothetical protein
LISVHVSSKYPGVAATGRVDVSVAHSIWCAIKLSSGAGSCRLSSRTLSIGTHKLIGTYLGSANFDGSASRSASLVVLK